MTRIIIQLIFPSIYKWKSTILVINGHFAVQVCPLSSTLALFPPLNHSASRVFSPLNHFLMRICVFHVLNSSRPGWRGRSKASLWAAQLLKNLFTHSNANAKGRCFGYHPSSFFTFLCFWLQPYPPLITTAHHAAIFLIVKSGGSWTISPGGHSLSSSLNMQQVLILKTWEGNDGGLKRGQSPELYEDLSPSYCFKMETEKAVRILQEMQEERLKR